MKRNIILSAISLVALVLALIGIWVIPEHKTAIICATMGICLVCNALPGIRHGK